MSSNVPAGLLSQTATPSLTGKREWTVWLIGLLIGCAALGVLYLSRPGNASLQAWQDPMTVLIVALFVVTLWRSASDIRLLDRESRLQVEQVQLLDQLNDVKQFLKVAEPSVFRDHIRALNTILLRHSEISQESLIEVLHAKLLSRNRVVELLANILITLGLIGTIIGLLMSVGTLADALDPTQGRNVERVMDALHKTVGALGTAFYTTLAGALCGGVVLRILTSIVDANIQRYVASLAELAEVYVLPAMRRAAQNLERSGYYERLDQPAR